ncbi:Dynlrb2 [Symbiodinium sp. CCMP2592]|nr:Dynlrb2 [Symbiodinium sp. CCMP2592]
MLSSSIKASACSIFTYWCGLALEHHVQFQPQGSRFGLRSVSRHKFQGAANCATRKALYPKLVQDLARLARAAPNRSCGAPARVALPSPHVRASGDMSEVEETLNRIKTHRGVSGIVIVNAESVPIRSTLDKKQTEQYSELVSQLAAKAPSWPCRLIYKLVFFCRPLFGF